MNFNTDFRAEDYAELCWFQTKLATTVLSVALSVAFGATLAGFVHNILIGILFAVIVCPIIKHFQKRSVIKRANRRFGAFGTSSELNLVVNEDEILQISNSGETRLAWQDVYSVRESENSYYVFLTKRKAFYFPKRSFESEKQKREFLDYIGRYAPREKVKIKAEN